MRSASASPNRDRLTRTARRIRPILPELVFIGGQIAELLVTDPGAVRVRPTDDVDVIVRVTTRSAYRGLEHRLAEVGFNPDSRPGAPICRFRSGDDLLLDVMPLDESILGFTNRWYLYALESAEEAELESQLVVRIASAPAFLTTKWEAFAHRGIDDPLTSHDLEDIVTLVAGRSTIVEEVTASRDDVRNFIAESTSAFLADSWSMEIIEASLPDARRIPGLVNSVARRLRAISEAAAR